MFQKTTIMKISIIVLVILTLIFMMMAILQLANVDISFNNWFTVILIIIFAVIQLICIVSETFSFKKAGFYLLHIGLIAFLTGNFMYFLKGNAFYSYLNVDKSTYSIVPAYPKTSSSNEHTDNVEYVELGFSIGVDSFQVERYVDNPSMDKWYEAVIISNKISVSSSSDIPGKVLAINSPLKLGKYKIYFMGYDKMTEQSIYVYYKYDPGETIATTGIFMIISGSFIMAFMKFSPKQEKAGEKKCLD